MDVKGYVAVESMFRCLKELDLLEFCEPECESWRACGTHVTF